jgi:hypothetical protein
MSSRLQKQKHNQGSSMSVLERDRAPEMAFGTLRTYQPSGLVGARAWLIAFAVGLPAALGSGWVLAWAQSSCSGFWATAICSVVAAFVAFVGLGMVADGMHARHRGVLTGVGLMLMLVMMAARWAFTLGWPQGDMASWPLVQADGQWDWGLALGAVAEAAFIVLMGVLSFRGQTKTPYSETAHAWARQSMQGELWCTDDQGSLLSALKQRGAAHLLDMPRAMDLQVTPASAAWQTLQVSGLWVEADTSARWLNLTQVAHTRDHQGKVKASATNWLENWLVSDGDYRAIARHLATPGREAAKATEGGAHLSAEAAPTPPELMPALAAMDAGQHQAALSLAQPFRQHPEAAVQADAIRLCAMALSRMARWPEAFETYHQLFALESTVFNALQLATTSVMAGELLRGQAWYDKTMALNHEGAEMPDARLCTAYLSALEQAGEFEATQPHLDWLAAGYQALRITDDHFLWSRGLPFFSEFLRKATELQRPFKDEAGLRAWFEAMRSDLDEDGQNAVDRHLAELAHVG